MLKSILPWANVAQYDSNDGDTLIESHDSEKAGGEVDTELAEGGDQEEGPSEVVSDNIVEGSEAASESLKNNYEDGDGSLSHPDEISGPEEAIKLLENVRVMKMEPWEMAMALKYPFVRGCSGLVISFAKRLLAISSNRAITSVCEPIRRDELGRNNPFAFTFNVTKNETSSGSWEFKVPLYSRWKKDEATGRKWRLKIKENERDRKHISIHMFVDNTGGSIKISKYEIFLLRNKRNEQVPYYLRGINRTINPGRGYGFRYFISQESLFKEGTHFMSSNRESLTSGAIIYQGSEESSSSESDN